MKSLIVLLAMTIIACAGNPERRELRRICASERGLTDSRCPEPRVVSTKDLVRICTPRGIVRDDERDCHYVTQEDLRRALERADQMH